MRLMAYCSNTRLIAMRPGARTSQEPPLRIRENEPSASEALPQHAVLSLQVLNRLRLLALDPTGTASDQIGEKTAPLRHAPIVAGLERLANGGISGRLSFGTVRGENIIWASRRSRRSTPQRARSRRISCLCSTSASVMALTSATVPNALEGHLTTDQSRVPTNAAAIASLQFKIP